MATPLTDRWIQPGPGHDCVTGEDIPVVHADDCRRLEESHARLLEALEQISAIENKCADAWCGGIGDATLDELIQLGRIARAAIADALEIK